MATGLAHYSCSVGAIALAVLLRAALHPVLGDTLPLVTLYGAVAFAVWYGGAGPAALATFLGYAACGLLFFDPPLPAGLDTPRGQVSLAIHLVTCAIIIRFGRAMRRARTRAEAGRESLRVTIASVADAVITTDAQGRVSMMNPVAESLTGWTEAEAIHRPLGDVFRVLDERTRRPIGNPIADVTHAGPDGRPANPALLVRKNGDERAIDHSTATIRDEADHVRGTVLTFRDTTERRQWEQENWRALNAARFLAAIVESSGDAIVSKSLDGTIQSWNAAAERLFGYTEAEVVGKHITIVIPPDRAAEEDLILGRIRVGGRVDHFETIRVRKDGSPIHVSLTISPIRDQFGHIVGASKIIRDITDRKETEERIYSLVAELKASDRRKDEFLAMLGHELRGPLAPIRNMLEVLLRADGDREMLQRASATMDRQLKLLVRLVDDLIDVGRITSGRIELQRETLDLASIVPLAIESVRPLIDAAKHELQVTMPHEPLHVHADRVRLTQVLNNLLTNAAKYTEPGGRIWLTVEAADGAALVKVRDTGLGIPADKFGSVFEMFGQVDRTLDHSQGGLGVGLALARRLVEMHDGTLTVRSDGANRGSEFTARLPLASRRPAILLPAPAALPEIGHRRILVVDDNPDSSSTLAMLLTITGNETRTAGDGLEAIRLAEEFRPDLVLLDLGLPRLNGHDACRRIREQPWGREMLIVAVTGWGQEEDRRLSKEAGFDAHMVKPLDYEALMKLLANAAEVRAAR